MVWPPYSKGNRLLVLAGVSQKHSECVDEEKRCTNLFQPSNSDRLVHLVSRNCSIKCVTIIMYLSCSFLKEKERAGTINPWHLPYFLQISLRLMLIEGN
jgi:hypothetical protein